MEENKELNNESVNIFNGVPSEDGTIKDLPDLESSQVVVEEENNLSTEEEVNVFNADSSLEEESNILTVPPVEEELADAWKNENLEESNDSEVKVSGTATEEEIVIDATKPEDEVLDEDVIKKDVKKADEKQKNNTLFIATIVGIIVIFIIALPFLVKIIGI